MPVLSPPNLLSQLQWRYAVKEFDPDRRIPDDLWDTLEQSLVLAPSSFGLQPWKFLVLTDPVQREKLVEHSWNQRQVAECSHYVIFAAPTNLGPELVDAFADHTASVRQAPPESLASFRKMVKGFLEGFDPETRIAWASRQVYLTLGQFMTSAAVLGIDTCPMEGFSPPDYDRLLDLPAQDLTAVVCCAAGYRKDSDKYASLPKVRFPREQVIQHLQG
jgi:nitroreductase